MPLLDIDPLTGAVETMRYDHITKALTITRTTDHSAVLDANAESYNDGGEAWRGESNELWHVGRIPEDVLYMWLYDFNLNRPQGDKVQSPYWNNEDWERFLWGRFNSSEYRKLKTAPVTV